MAYSLKLHEKAIHLRKIGNSLNEIHDKLRVSKSTLSEWLRDVVLSSGARQRLLKRITAGQLVSAENKRKKIKELKEDYYIEALQKLNSIDIDKNISLLIVALIYWCEGAKDFSRGVDFTNSDPNLIKTFLKLLRHSFILDENRFRVVVHLHEYHDREQQLKFWQDVTGIPSKQFTKPYLKKHTGKRKRKNYNGCISVRYYDVNVGRRLLLMAEAFLKK